MKDDDKIKFLPWVALIILVILTIIFSVNGTINLWPEDVGWRESYSFGQIIRTGDTQGPISDFYILDYFFGPVPKILVDMTGTDPRPVPPTPEVDPPQPTQGYSAVIIVIAMWIAFFLIFVDIMYMFGGFNNYVNWVVGLCLTIVGANLKVISFLFGYFLGVLSVFGALGIFLAIAYVFILFIAFHFGGTAFRKWFILRRAQDHAIRAAAGGKKVASAVEVLREIADEAEEAGK